MSFWVQIPLHTCTIQIMLYCGWDIGRCSSHLKLGSECQWIMAASHGSAYCQVVGLSFVRLAILVTCHRMPSLQLDPSYGETLSGEISVLKAQNHWDVRSDHQLYLPLYMWILPLIYQSPLDLLQKRAIQSWSHRLHVALVELYQSSRYWH